MPFLEGSQDGVLNDTTPVTVVSSPGASVRRVVRTITVQNKDTAPIGLILRFVNGIDERQLGHWNLDPDDSLLYNEVHVLDTTGKSIDAYLDGAVATNQPEWTSSFGDSS